MCTESSNQQRMWKDLLGETLRAFLARCILFLFCEMEKKPLYTSSQLQIWLEAHLEESVCNCEVLLEINWTKSDEGHKEIWHCWIARNVLLDFESNCSVCHLSGCAHGFRSPCTLSSSVYPWEMREWTPCWTGAVDSEFAFAPLVHDKRSWRSRTSIDFHTPCLTDRRCHSVNSKTRVMNIFILPQFFRMLINNFTAYWSI